MKPRISVHVEDARDGWSANVTLDDGASKSQHDVAVARETHAEIAGESVAVEELVRASFEFLLEREPKESILSRFDLSVISQYFPEYKRELTARLRR